MKKTDPYVLLSEKMALKIKFLIFGTRDQGKMGSGLTIDNLKLFDPLNDLFTGHGFFIPLYF